MLQAWRIVIHHAHADSHPFSWEWSRTSLLVLSVLCFVQIVATELKANGSHLHRLIMAGCSSSARYCGECPDDRQVQLDPLAAAASRFGGSNSITSHRM